MEFSGILPETHRCRKKGLGAGASVRDAIHIFKPANFRAVCCIGNLTLNNIGQYTLIHSQGGGWWNFHSVRDAIHIFKPANFRAVYSLYCIGNLTLNNIGHYTLIHSQGGGWWNFPSYTVYCK